MTQKHTPGPWEVIQVCDDVYIECANLDEKSVKTICSLNRKSDYANAHLIAAAPDLLATLERCLGDYKGLRAKFIEHGFIQSAGDVKETIDYLEAAIAKAKGASC